MLITKVEYFPESKIQEDLEDLVGLSYRELFSSTARKLIDFSGRVVTKSGAIKTYKNGKLHSYHDDPAVIFSTGAKMWYLEGKKTRIGGPAETYSDGRIRWWLDDVLLSFPIYMSRMDEETQVKILLTYSGITNWSSMWK